MADIFISYSRKDSAIALTFAEKLRASGKSIWIDQHGIEAASSWSGEIVRAINQCTVFIVLLSRSSILSDNVVREIALAYEKKKKILPIELESVVLPEPMEYPLAGIQKISNDNWESIDRVLSKLIVPPIVSVEIESTLPVPIDPLGRKTIAVLPFENLSSDPDNEWFADGLTQEIIGILTKLSSLYVTDRRSVMAYKNSSLPIKTIAQELGVEFIIEGTVRKSGSNLRISSELLEAKTGKHIWSETLKGTIDDIFEIQESVAKSIAEGLDIALNTKDKESLKNTLTTNSEAYELYLRSLELAYSKEQVNAIPLLERAIELDPNFLKAYTGLSSVYNRNRHKDPQYLELAHKYALKAYTLDPSSSSSNIALGAYLFNSGNPESAYQYLIRAYQSEPDQSNTNAWMGFYYSSLKEYRKAAAFYERALELEPGQPHFVMHLINIYTGVNDTDALRDLAARALPHIELRLRTSHDHEAADHVFISLLSYADRSDEIIPAIQKLDIDSITDPTELYNFACAVVSVDLSFAMKLLRLSIDRGFRDIGLMKSDPDLDPLRSTPEFAALVKELAQKSAKEKNG